MYSMLNRVVVNALALVAVTVLSTQESRADLPEYNRLADLSRKLGEKKDWAGAERTIQEALKIRADDEWAWRHLSWCQRNQGKFEEAVKSARAAQRLHKTPWGYYDLAEAAYGSLDFDLARETATEALALGRKVLGNAWEPLRGVLDRVSVKEYTLTDKVDPRKCRIQAGKISLFVAHNAPPYQTAKSVAVNVRSFVVLPWGDLTVLQVVPKGNEPFEIVSTIRVTPTPMRKAVTRYAAKALLPDKAKPYLGATPGVELGGQTVAKLAKQLRGQDDLETVSKVVSWFGKEFTYDGNAGGTTEQIAKARRGHCDAMARLSSALCRLNGVACRPVRMNWGDNPRIPWHSVCEVYVRGQGWVPFDPGTSSFGTWPNTRWPGNALSLHYYLADDRNAPQWVEYVRPGDAPPTCSARAVTKIP